MIYPDNIEKKLGFDEIKDELKGKCLSPLGKSLADALAYSSDSVQINKWMEEIREMRDIEEKGEDFLWKISLM